MRRVALSVVVAPDSFKGSLPAHDVAVSISAGWSSIRPGDAIALIPQADGGEGTLDAIEADVEHSVRHTIRGVSGPEGRPTTGEWLELPDGVVVVELAQMNGLPLMNHLDPLGAHTRGLGEVIAAALATGARSLVLGLGGSASTDGGAGALSALGLRLTDAAGTTLPDGGGALTLLSALSLTGLRPPPADGVVLLTDVTAPLLGPTGAAAVFGPQKGATAAEVIQLDRALARFADLLGGNPTQLGTGAAGGTAYGFAAAWGANIFPGADYIAELTGLEVAMANADVVLTGEGKFDEQSLTGKVVGRILDRAEHFGARAGVIAGQIALPPVTPRGEAVWAVSLSELAPSIDAARDDPRRWLFAAGAAAATAIGR